MSLIRAIRKPLLSQNRLAISNAVRTHWNKDYKPRPFPQTTEERLAAACRYGIIPDDYKPLPDDGTGHGDYPQLPAVSGEAKDPNYPWDNPELKRNFNEPLHVDFDLMGEDRYDVSHRLRTSLPVQFLQFAVVMFGTFAIYYKLQCMKMFPGLIPKQYPFQGIVHYNFEIPDPALAEEDEEDEEFDTTLTEEGLDAALTEEQEDAGPPKEKEIMDCR